MPVVTCPHCGEKGKVSEKHLGKRGECSECGNVYTLEKTTLLVKDDEDTFEISDADLEQAETDTFRPVDDQVEFCCDNCGMRLVGNRSSLAKPRKCPSCKQPVTLSTATNQKSASLSRSAKPQVPGLSPNGRHSPSSSSKRQIPVVIDVKLKKGLLGKGVTRLPPAGAVVFRWIC